MSFRPLILITLACLAGLSGCKKKTEAELAEKERIKLRESKRAEAAATYKTLADKFPLHPKAQEAAAKAQALSSQAPKK